MAGPLKGYLWSTAASYEYILGEYEDPKTLGTFISWLTPGSVFYDVGANIGFHSLIANRIIQTGTIYAFEPMPAMMEGLQAHIRLNQTLMISNKIEAHAIAIAQKDGQLLFSNNQASRDGNTYIQSSYVFAGSTDKIQVEGRSIDGLIGSGFKKPDIIKIDAEGAEYDILLGAADTLDRYHPNILLATHDCHLPGVQQNCIDFLQRHGYQLTHTGKHNKHMEGLDDYIAIHKSKLL